MNTTRAMTAFQRARHNLTYVHGSKEITPLLYLFVYFSFVTGVGFLFLALTHSSHALTMYQVMLGSAGWGGTVLWATLSIVSALGVIATLLWRERIIAEPVAFLGFGLWFYMAWLYGTQGYWDGIVMAAVPNMLFWAWFSMRIDWYRRVVVPLRRKH